MRLQEVTVQVGIEGFEVAPNRDPWFERGDRVEDAG